jgi:hypothetical protein
MNSPTAPSSGSAASIAARATPSMTTTPNAIGMGATGAQVASTSALAFDSSSPVG